MQLGTEADIYTSKKSNLMLINVIFVTVQQTTYIKCIISSCHSVSPNNMSQDDIQMINCFNFGGHLIYDFLNNDKCINQ